MIIVMKQGASKLQIENVVSRVEDLGYEGRLIEGEERTIIGVVGDDRQLILANSGLSRGSTRSFRY